MKRAGVLCFILLLVSLFKVEASDIYLYNNLKIDNQTSSKAVSYAIEAIQKDFNRKFGHTVLIKYRDKPITLTFRIKSDLNRFDQFTTTITPQHIQFEGTDEIGLIHCIYNFSAHILGIDPCIYFTGLMPDLKTEIKVKTGSVASSPYSIKYRGFFLNDEDLLTGFKMEKLAYGFNLDFMQKVFETILRLQMNGVIPSTLVLSDEPHLVLASDMGLYIMQHHAEPVGSVPLFWPKDKTYSWSTNKQAFVDFWTTAIKRQKAKHVIWTIGFRGLLDRSFWSDDPTITEDSSPEEKAKIINDVIATQYNLIKKITDTEQPLVSAVLRAETISLFEKNLLKFPDGTMVLFCDNGNAKISSGLIDKVKGSPYPIGTYLHVSYHNRNASMRINTTDPSDLFRQMKEVFDNKMDCMCVLNVGNMKEKVFGMQQMALYLTHYDKYKHVDGETYYRWYVKHKFGVDSPAIIEAYKGFIKNQFTIDGQRLKMGDEFYSCFVETALHMLFTRKQDSRVVKTYLPTILAKKVACLGDNPEGVTQELKMTMTFYSSFMDSIADQWETSMQRAYDAQGELLGNKLDFYKIDVMYPTEKMYHLTSMVAKLSKAVLHYMDQDFHAAQGACYAALEQAKAASTCEEKIEKNHVGEFNYWYRFDQNARTEANLDFIEHFLNNIKDMKYMSLAYKYRNSKTPDLQYKFQPWFKSKYKDELFYMNNAQ